MITIPVDILMKNCREQEIEESSFLLFSLHN